MSNESPWRVGRKLRRTVYCSEKFVALFDDPGLAECVVNKMNDDWNGAMYTAAPMPGAVVKCICWPGCQGKCAVAARSSSKESCSAEASPWAGLHVMCGRCGAVDGTHGSPCIDDEKFMARLRRESGPKTSGDLKESDALRKRTADATEGTNTTPVRGPEEAGTISAPKVSLAKEPYPESFGEAIAASNRAVPSSSLVTCDELFGDKDPGADCAQGINDAVCDCCWRWRELSLKAMRRSSKAVPSTRSLLIKLNCLYQARGDNLNEQGEDDMRNHHDVLRAFILDSKRRSETVQPGDMALRAEVIGALPVIEAVHWYPNLVAAARRLREALALLR